ncbi:MAG TPA: hypothetical protein VJT73_11460 [Polyangiaceae bacterium]|nr:hypothetical protein [Polyangiaceae bacterium]
MRGGAFKALGFALVAWSASCGGDDARPSLSRDLPGPTVGTDAQAPKNPALDGGSTTVCSSGETRECTIDRGTFKGIHDCVKGTQACGDDGQWAACIEL